MVAKLVAISLWNLYTEGGGGGDAVIRRVLCGARDFSMASTTVKRVFDLHRNWFPDVTVGRK